MSLTAAVARGCRNKREMLSNASVTSRMPAANCFEFELLSSESRGLHAIYRVIKL